MIAERGATAEDAARPTGATQVDPREVAEGFQSLLPDVQAVVREGWRREGALDERIERRARSQRKRDMSEAFAIVGFTELCLYGFDVTHLFAAAAVSALIGEAWWRPRGTDHDAADRGARLGHAAGDMDLHKSDESLRAVV